MKWDDLQELPGGKTPQLGVHLCCSGFDFHSVDHVVQLSNVLHLSD